MEKRNLAVFTTESVLKQEPILYVNFEEDGDWQFHGVVESDLRNRWEWQMPVIYNKETKLNEINSL